MIVRLGELSTSKSPCKSSNEVLVKIVEGRSLPLSYFSLWGRQTIDFRVKGIIHADV
jgi:hypothetical protein